MKLRSLQLLALTAIMMISSSAFAVEQYKFKVHNNTRRTIKKILVSEDGEEYGYFKIGREGIKPGKTVTLVWDASTNDESCDQWFKAVWSNGEESEPVQFDFCEDDVVLEFE